MFNTADLNICQLQLLPPRTKSRSRLVWERGAPSDASYPKQCANSAHEQQREAPGRPEITTRFSGVIRKFHVINRSYLAALAQLFKERRTGDTCSNRSAISKTSGAERKVFQGAAASGVIFSLTECSWFISYFCDCIIRFSIVD